MEYFNEKLIAAERGDMDAALEIADYVLFSDDDPIEEDMLKRVKKYLERAVESGNGVAMRMVGDMYHMGRGVDLNEEKAAFWYDKAAALGIEGAVEKLKEAKPEQIDPEKLFKDYARAAMAGDPMGYFRIGEMYSIGEYVPQDDKEAFNCYILAHQLASRDKSMECYPDICMKIGECIYRGIGTESSVMEAKNFFEEASDYYRMLYNKGDDSKLDVYRQSQKAVEEVEHVMGSGCNGVI